MREEAPNTVFSQHLRVPSSQAFGKLGQLVLGRLLQLILHVVHHHILRSLHERVGSGIMRTS